MAIQKLSSASIPRNLSWRRIVTDPAQRRQGAINHHNDGRGLYFEDTDGHLLEIITRSIEIECLPDEIPESFTVNVSELMIGQAKRGSDVELSGSMKLLSDPQLDALPLDEAQLRRP